MRVEEERPRLENCPVLYIDIYLSMYLVYCIEALAGTMLIFFGPPATQSTIPWLVATHTTSSATIWPLHAFFALLVPWLPGPLSNKLASLFWFFKLCCVIHAQPTPST